MPIVVLLPCVSSADARDDTKAAGILGWSPSLAVGMDLYVQKLQVKGTGSFTPAGGTRIDVPGDASRTTYNALIRLGGALRGPVWESLPGEPRLLLNGAALIPASRSESLGGASSIVPNPNFNGNDPQSPEQFTLESAFDLELNLMWEAGVGLEFVLSEDPEIRLAPKLVYRGSSISYEGSFSRTTGFPTVPSIEIGIRASDALTQHFLGPGLDLEVGFAERDRFLFSIFLEGSASWLLGDAIASFGRSDTTLGVASTAAFRFESKRLIGSFGGGFRVAWW